MARKKSLLLYILCHPGLPAFRPITSAKRRSAAMWAVGDPVMYFTRYPGRFLSMHLQGEDLNTPAPGSDGRQAGRASRAGLAVGKDSVDWPKVFAAARKCGVKNYFVEQSWDLTVQSVAYLKTIEG